MSEFQQGKLRGGGVYEGLSVVEQQHARSRCLRRCPPCGLLAYRLALSLICRVGSEAGPSLGSDVSEAGPAVTSASPSTSCAASARPPPPDASCEVMLL